MLQLLILGISFYFTSHAVSGASTAGLYSTTDAQALAPANSTSVPTPDSAFFLCIKITNRIFNESLENQSSEDYGELRGELTRLLDDVYTSEPYNYSGISAMTFSRYTNSLCASRHYPLSVWGGCEVAGRYFSPDRSENVKLCVDNKGSVVANTTILFRTTEINPSVVKNLFLDYVKKNPPSNLELNITEVQEIPLPDVGHQENGMTSATTQAVSPRLNTATETTVNHESTSSPGITNTKTIVSETPSFTQTVGSMPDTTRFHSENNATISSLTGSISSTTDTANYTSDDTTVTSKGTTESSSSGSTQSQLTHDIKDYTTTSYSLRSSSVNPITNFSISSISGGSTRNTSFTSSSTTNDSLSETYIPHINSSIYSSSSPTVHLPVSTAMTTVITSSHNTTIDSTEITNDTSLNITQSPPLVSTTTDHPINGTPNTSESSTALFATTFTPHSASPHPNPGTTAQHASSRPASTASTSSPPLGKTTRSHTTRTASAPHPSPTSSASAGAPDHTTAAAGGNSQEVPGWAIALLVLASLILLFLILLFITLLVYWCCKRRQYDFMNMSEDPRIYDQINRGPDIPMYTTHSPFESSNGKPYEEMEKPMKTRATYTVNQR